MDFGELLRDERTLRGLTQEELAEAAGLTSRSIRSLEAGATKPRRSTVAMLCDALALPARRREVLLRAGGFSSRLASGANGGDACPSQLPPAAADFTGRERQVKQLCDSLAAAPDTERPGAMVIAEVLTEALEIRRRAGDKTGEASVLNSLGFVFRGQGRLAEGLGYHQSALAVLTTVSEPRLVAVSLHNIGVALQDLKRCAEALDYLARALAVSQQIGERYGEALTENSLGEVLSPLTDSRNPSGISGGRGLAAQDTARGSPTYGRPCCPSSTGAATRALPRCAPGATTTLRD